MLLLIGIIIAAAVIAVLAVEPRERGTSVLDEYCSTEYTTIRQHRLNCCC